MKKTYFAAVLILIVVVFGALYLQSTRKNDNMPEKRALSSDTTQEEIQRELQNKEKGENPEATAEKNSSIAPGDLDNSDQEKNEFTSPMDRASERVTKKKFGTYITPQSSPVTPERFSGYHLGADFEVFPEELMADVSVRAVCAGKLLQKRTASGYGGIAVQSCEISGSPVTVIYGHLKLSSIKSTVGDNLKAGDFIGVLGADKSTETDGERKHLHLAFHKGVSINIRGYAGSRAELSNWLDPCLYVCEK